MKIPTGAKLYRAWRLGGPEAVQNATPTPNRISGWSQIGLGHYAPVAFVAGLTLVR